MVKIVHISDLHYGSKDFREDCLLNVIEYINNKKPDIVICTGDLTHKAKKQEYERIREYLNEIKTPLLCVPGNHDAKHNGLVFYERFIGPRRSSLILENENAIILGVRSCKDGTSEGELHDEQLKWIIQKLKNHPNKLKIMALHHHLISVPHSGVKYSVVVDSGEALELIRLFNVDLVLMGHKHCPHVWTLGNSVLLYSGTTSSFKTRADENPCFNEISLNEDELIAHAIDSLNYHRDLLVRQKRGEIDYVKLRKARIDHIIQSSVFESSF